MHYKAVRRALCGAACKYAEGQQTDLVEWLPALNGYTLAGDYLPEFYQLPAKGPDDTVSYICIPLKKTER